MMDVIGAAAALRAAMDAGLLAALVERGRATPRELADAAGLHAGATGLVLDVLVAAGAADRDGEAFVPSPYLEGWLQLQAIGSSRFFAHLPEFLRTGEPMAGLDEAREAAYRVVTPTLGVMFRRAADTLAASLELELTPRRVLDVGCGSGVWGLAIGARHPETQVTGLDLPAVLDGFRAHAAERGLADRIDTIPGDVHALDLPAGAFDLAVIANVLRIESEARAQDLVARVAPAVAPGGAILVVDALGGGTLERELSRTVYAMQLALRNRDGRVHTPATIRSWLAATGFGVVQAVEVPRGPGGLGALLARRG